MRGRIKKSGILSLALAGLMLISGCQSADNAEPYADEPDNIEEAKSYMSTVEISTFCPEEYLVMEEGVDYGEIVRTTYYSETCGMDRNVNIVLPAGYSEKEKYPVLYILHGIFGDQNSMLGDGNSGIRVEIGNLINKGEAKSMILVFPDMYAKDDPSMAPTFDAESVKPYDNFLNDLTNDLMPFMEENYSVATGRLNTGVLGFSMGGRESLAIGFTYPDLFGYVGAIAPAPGLVPGRDWAMEHEGQFAEEELVFSSEKGMPYLLMIGAGDSDGTVGQFPKSYHELLDKNSVAHLWYEIPGSDHGDPAISSVVYNFVKAAFKAK